MSKNTDLIQLAGLHSLSTLNEVLSKLGEQVAILEDERDEYRRKWLEATKCESTYEEQDIKQISN